MSEKQLTVAELLARSGKKPADSSRPRRRRSVEEGGISIAELTGNIPKVDAKPATGKHNTDSIDNPDAPKPVSTPQPEKAEKVEKEAPAASTGYATPASAKPQVKTPAPEAKPEPQADSKAAVTAAPAKPEMKRAEVKAKSATPANDETVVLSVVDEKDPVRLTTGAFPAVTKEQAEKAESQEKKPLSQDEQAPKVELQEEKPLSPAEQAAKAKAAAVDAEKDSEQTNVIPAIKDEDLKAAKPEEEELTDEEELDEEDVEYVDEDEEWDEEDVEYVDEDEEEEWDEDESVSVPAIIGMAIAGILLGVLVFKGFEMLWGSLNRGIVTVLALAVTAVMVGVIHALRTNRDRLSMALAVVVGLIMTFGPLLTIS